MHAGPPIEWDRMIGVQKRGVCYGAIHAGLAKTPEEKDYLMSKMFPAMIVGGFVTVTITSVILAGIFAKMF